MSYFGSEAAGKLHEVMILKHYKIKLARRSYYLEDVGGFFLDENKQKADSIAFSLHIDCILMKN
jgi:hypothetical protein